MKHNTITHDFDSGWQGEILPPQENDDHLSEASKLLRQGIQQQQAGELIVAVKSLQQSLGLFQAVGDLQKQAQVLSFLGLVTYSAGD
ncbi:MAG: tetratricopeptide repeat protein, partial [Nostoc sp.]